MILFSIVGIGLIVLFAVSGRKSKAPNGARFKTVKAHIPTAVQALVLTAQAGELVRVAEHVDVVNLAAAGLLLAIVLATKSGTEGQLH